MKLLLFSIFLFSASSAVQAQEVLRLKNGSTITVQNGVELTLQGGITLENGSLLINNGTTRLKNDVLAGQSDWKDNSVIGALGGEGLVIFNSNLTHQYSGPTHFYNVDINTGGLTAYNHLPVENQLHLIKGKINTGINYVFLNNNNSSSLLNDASNIGYANCWINGNFRRLIASNSSTYDFPVGNSTRCNLLQFLNNNLAGTNQLTASFGPNPGTDAGLNVTENGSVYTAVNNGGGWYLVPNASPSGGNYALQLFFTGFTGLTDNQFGILRRPDASSNAADWKIPPGSLREPFNGAGRKVSDGFTRRSNISDFSQLGIGTLSTVPCDNCAVVCTYSQGFYANQNGKACYSFNGTNSSISSSQLMLNAFGAATSQIFGNVANRQFFTLFKTDISNGNIFKMLPGSGNSQALGVDNVLPYDGAYYSDQNTWYLVPIPKSGGQKGKINNQLLSQTIGLWFNLRTSSSLAVVDLTRDTLVTTAQTSCGSGIPTGSSLKFGLPHSIVLYLNGGNGYTNNVNGLFQVANDVLGGVNTTVSPLDVQYAIAAVNNAFDGCRILTATLPYSQPLNILTRNVKLSDATKETVLERLVVTAFPNPYNSHFSLRIGSPISGMANIKFYDVNGSKVFEIRQFLADKITNIVPYSGPRHSGALMYKVRIGDYDATGYVIGIH